MKTNYVAYGILAIIVLSLLLVVFDFATLDQVTAYGTMLIALLTVLGFRSAADHKKADSSDIDEQAEYMEGLNK